MKKKHFVLMISSIIIASFALACTPKAPEDRIIKVIDTLHEKVSKAKDCDKLVKDLDSYCKGVSDSLTADAKLVMPASGFDQESPALKKIEKAMDKFENLEKSACANDAKVKEAFIKCLAPMMPDTSAFDDIEEEMEKAIEAVVEEGSAADDEAEVEVEVEAEVAE